MRECRWCHTQVSDDEVYDHLCEEAYIAGARLFDKDGRERVEDTKSAVAKFSRNSQMKVWLAFEGCIGEYTVVAVFSTEEKAEQYRKENHFAEIEEWTVDE